MSFDTLFSQQPYGVAEPDKTPLMVQGLNELGEFHYQNCEAYRRVIDGLWHGRATAENLADFPYLPVSLFKTNRMVSVPEEDLRITLTSSGTTGQAVSQILVDADTSMRQQKALANSLSHVLGPKRLPMLVLDTNAVFKDPALMSARGAGVLGIMRYGRNHVFALNEQLEPDFEAVDGFLDELDGAPFFMFGFTFVVWMQFFEKFLDRGLDLSNGTLIHSGGWKKMSEHAVDAEVFRERFFENFNLSNIYNFYGMVEQIGSIFLEASDGLLYPPNFTDIIIRNPRTWEPVPNGKEGVIQLLSLLPGSYPGHSLLTEDLGVIVAQDPNNHGWKGKGLRILGRVPKAELRGCSDVVGATIA